MLGVPPPDRWDEFSDWMTSLPDPDPDLADELAADVRLIDAFFPGRWNLADGSSEPDRKRPADMLIMRMQAAATADAEGRVDVGDQLATALHRAMPFWLPGHIAGGLAWSTVPEEGMPTIRLPADTVTVWFGQPISTASYPLLDNDSAAAVKNESNWATKDGVPCPIGPPRLLIYIGRHVEDF